MNTTAAIILAAVVGFAVTALLGFLVIPWLRKMKFGQTILDIGPRWHKSKQGIPTMGGILFIVGTLAAVGVTVLAGRLAGGAVISGKAELTKIWGGLFMALAFGLMGFFDDYIKVVKKRNLGLTILQKTGIQLVIAVAYLSVLATMCGTSMFVPFFGTVELGWLFWPFGVCVIYASINTANFTDGIDGLCPSVTFTTAVAFIVMAVLRQMTGLSILAAAFAGACAGFLVWNWHPARVIMGDTGSMFFGGLVVALAYGLDCPVILLAVAIVYVIEGLSDVIQITYYKATGGKRIFKMAPIHHHFELCGWKETKIVSVFTLINLVGCVSGVAMIGLSR